MSRRREVVVRVGLARRSPLWETFRSFWWLCQTRQSDSRVQWVVWSPPLRLYDRAQWIATPQPRQHLKLLQRGTQAVLQGLTE